MHVSVCNALSVSIISQASISAGVAAAAAAVGEARKDKQDEANVVAVGGQFYPLIVETFEVWTPFARDALRILPEVPQQFDLIYPLNFTQSA